MRRELAAALDAAKNLPVDQLPEFLGELEQIRITGFARITTPAALPSEDRLLDVEQAAARLHCSPDYLYRHHKKLPFTRPGRVGGKLLFSSAGLDAYLRGKR